MSPLMLDIGRIFGLVLIAALVVSAIVLAAISCLIRRRK